MGRISRLLYLPKRLGEKLFLIRRALNKTQSEMLEALNQHGEFSTLTQNVISDYEKNRREPPPLVLYAYGKIANIYVDVLVDDEIELPKKIPAARKGKA